ncbi:hypothetical protein [Pectobacterium phage Wc4-1]|uniref:Uncharacterized protein n=1 Tax=Pectobacterium phage Wc4 TaxID=2652428 RepID=A0A5P8D466_9CAUD|nr:hypothetical protein [Pectobacterium phage Wc4]QFP93919.1 hypothetical protein [Pectobacterium phage Wc4-1]
MLVTIVTPIPRKETELEAFEHVTPVMAAQAAMPWGRNTYGKTKAQTSYMVKYMGRTRRIYSDCHSNSAVLYVLVNGIKHYVR